MQICDAMTAGGLERMAVNIANSLPRDRFASHLCTTRTEGALETEVAPHVGRLRLHRKGKIGVRTLKVFRDYVRTNNIRILHAHGHAIFYGALASCLHPFVKIIWHDHWGRYAFDERPRWLYWAVARRLAGVIAVNQPLCEWATRQLHVSPDRVWYLPNFVCEGKADGSPLELPGEAGSRIVCVANFRAEKDHPNLFAAMRIVLREVPCAHVILLGTVVDAVYHEAVIKEMGQGELNGHVTWLGARGDVPVILKACDVAVLASSSEGLPVALIEYGAAGLAAVATDIGQCADVLDHGKVGLLVPTNDSERLAAALLTLLKSPATRADLGAKFKKRTQNVYSSEAVIGQVANIYDTVI